MKITFEENEAFSDILTDKIKAMNNKISPYHKAVREEGYMKYLLLEETRNGGFAAGLDARMFWNCMYIDTLYVEESDRGTGLGRLFLNKAIEIAREHQCKFIILTTFSFQAKDFYEKFGFYIIGEIKDYPPGESYYTMRKDLLM